MSLYAELAKGRAEAQRLSLAMLE